MIVGTRHCVRVTDRLQLNLELDLGGLSFSLSLAPQLFCVLQSSSITTTSHHYTYTNNETQ
jgi:hypothetical protein